MVMGQSADAAFSELGTVGVEEEFYIVDANGYPTAGTDTLVYEQTPPDPLAGRLDHELFKTVIETQIPTARGPSDAHKKLTTIRETLYEYAEAHGYRIAAAGLHPAAKWRELTHAEKPRYRSQLDRIQYPQHRNTTAGLHVHVGVDDPEKAVWIANELRWYLAPLLALSVNSPFWGGFDTGLQSARAQLFEGLPNTGIPTAFEDFATFQRFEQQLVASGMIEDRGELWYDVRPHTEHGTVELRVTDAQCSPDRTAIFIEYIHTLVLDFARKYEDGVTQTEYRRERLDLNKWRALRYGHEATFLPPQAAGWPTEPIDLETFINRERDRLGVTELRTLYEAESGATRQRRLATRGIDSLCKGLICH